MKQRMAVKGGPCFNPFQFSWVTTACNSCNMKFRQHGHLQTLALICTWKALILSSNIHWILKFRKLMLVMFEGASYASFAKMLWRKICFMFIFLFIFQSTSFGKMIFWCNVVVHFNLFEFYYVACLGSNRSSLQGGEAV